MIIVRTIGQASIEVGSTHITPASIRKFALLLYLSSEAGRHVPRSVLQEMVFPDQSEKNARHSLRELIYQFRQIGAQLDSNSAGVAVCASSVRVDHLDFLSQSNLSLENIREAEAGFLPGYAPAHSEAFSEWLDAHRAKLTFQLSRAVLRQAIRSRAVGDWAMTEHAARACLSLDPLNEDATLFLAEMLALNGAKAQALRLLDQYSEEVGQSSREMKLPASVLKFRITDRLPQNHRQRRGSRFVGRTEEMFELSERMREARRSRSQCLVLSGEPGIGKSRIVNEFCTLAVLDGATAATAAMQPNDAHRPFGAFVDLLPSLLAMPGALGCAPESLCSLERLTKGHVESAPVFDKTVDNEVLCQLLTHAIVDLIDSITIEQSLILAIEGVEWLDDMSSRVLTSLVDARYQRRLLALLTTRQQNIIPLLRSDFENLTTIHLRPLNSDATRNMTSSLAETAGVEIDPEMSRWLEETSQGNPLFLESLFSHHASTGERFTVSPTLTALLCRRVERLSSHALTVLRICALLGKHSTLEMISTAISLPKFALLRAVSELEAVGLIKADGTSVQPSHALIADVALKGAGAVETQLAHRCVATALANLPSGQHAAAVLWDCAEHWIAANDPEQSLRAIGSCVRYAIEMGRPRDAAGILERALTLDLFRDARVEIARQLIIASDAAAESELVLEGLRILRCHGLVDKHDDVEFAEFRARARVFQDAPIERERLLRCAAASDAQPSHRVNAAMWLLRYADIHGQAEVAAEAINIVPESILQRASDKERVEFILVRSCVLREWDEAGKAARELLSLAFAESSSTRILTQLNAAVGLWRSGFLPSALDVATQAYVGARASGFHRLGVTVACFLADVSYQLDDDDTAQLWMDRALETVSNVPELRNHFPLALLRIASALFAGDLERARSLFEDARSLGLFEGSQLRERWAEAFKARLLQLSSGIPMPDSEIVRISREVDGLHPMSGVLDFEVVTACEALMLTARCAEATALCRRFLDSSYRPRVVASRRFRRITDTIDRVVADRYLQSRNTE